MVEILSSTMASTTIYGQTRKNSFSIEFGRNNNTALQFDVLPHGTKNGNQLSTSIADIKVSY